MKRFFTLAVLACCFISCQQNGTPSRADAIAAHIRNPKSDYVVVVSHRGDWRNHPENSIPAIESLIEMGGDMVEMDLKMTKDSVLVLSHDYSVKRCTNFDTVFADEPDKSPKIKDLTYAETQMLRLKFRGTVIDSVNMPTLREALACCKDRICVNVDQGYDYYDEVLAITEELGVTNQVLIKGAWPIETVAANEARHENNMMYMPIVNIQREKGKALFQSYLDQGVVPLAYEVCWQNNDDDAFPQACQKILEQGSKVWVNTMWGELCGGEGNADEDAFKAENPGDVYGQYLEKGASMIQTDRPALMIGWLESIGRHTL